MTVLVPLMAHSFPWPFSPLKDPEDFWTLKFMYAINLMLVCDHSARIIYALHGWCGSSHNQCVSSSSQVCIWMVLISRPIKLICLMIIIISMLNIQNVSLVREGIY